VNRILARQQIAEHDPRVWICCTGVGRAVFDIFKTERVPRIVPVTITFGGEDGPKAHGGHNVTKLGLVSRLQALMHTGKLHMPDTLPLSKLFRRELLDFRVSYTAVGNATFGAREGAHDDLILAVALAVYGLDGGRVATVQPLSEGILSGFRFNSLCQDKCLILVTVNQPPIHQQRFAVVSVHVHVTVQGPSLEIDHCEFFTYATPINPEVCTPCRH
jgi:hypothetical protein